MSLVLASTSPYRRMLLERLGLPFSVAPPGVDESRQPGESPPDLVLRLATAKAQAVARQFPASHIIGSDQVAILGEEILGKPGDRPGAVAQLQRLSGKTATFLTAICVHASRTGKTLSRLVPCQVSFRNLDDGLIERYLAREQPYDCAGSAKVESLGIVLIERIQGGDPNALVGLPLIALVDLLREHGVDVL